MLTRSRNRNSADTIPAAENIVAESTLAPPTEQSKETAKEASEIIENQTTPQTSPAAQTATKEETEGAQIKLVQKYFKQIGFSGSFAGIQSFQHALWAEKGIHISQKVISKAMHQVRTSYSASCGEGEK